MLRSEVAGQAAPINQAAQTNFYSHKPKDCRTRWPANSDTVLGCVLVFASSGRDLSAYRPLDTLCPWLSSSCLTWTGGCSSVARLANERESHKQSPFSSSLSSSLAFHLVSARLSCECFQSRSSSRRWLWRRQLFGQPPVRRPGQVWKRLEAKRVFQVRCFATRRPFP